MAIFRRGTSNGSSAMPTATQPAEREVRDPSGRKSGPTPSRKEAEAARMARVRTPRTRKEQVAAARGSRSSRRS